MTPTRPRESSIGRQVEGAIVALEDYPGVKTLEAVIKVAHGWPGHRPGQLAFAPSDASGGALLHHRLRLA